MNRDAPEPPRQSRYAAHDLSAEELLTALGETTPAMLWLGDVEGKCVFLNAALREFWGVDPENLKAFDWTSTLHPDDIEKLSAPFIEAMREQKPFSVEARYRRADGAYRILRTRANPRFTRDGVFLGMTGVNTDITDQHTAEEKNRLIMGELNHRVKNILMVVHALARQTARNSAPEDFEQALLDRIQNLAASNDMLLKSDWSGVHLSDLAGVEMGLLPESTAARLTVSGPEIVISPGEAQTAGMALHELMTNSLKHGALAEAGGRVELSWSWLDPAKGRWRLEWREHVDDQAPPPTRQGFGHTVLVDMVASAFEAEVDLEYTRTGLVYRVTACKGTIQTGR